MEQIWNLIQKTNQCVLATSKNDKPRASIMEYTVIDKQLFFSTARHSIKGENLSQNKNVSISIISQTEYATLDGIFQEATQDEIKKFQDILGKKHPEILEMEKNGAFGEMLYMKLTNITAYYSNRMNGFTPPLIFKL